MRGDEMELEPRVIEKDCCLYVREKDLEKESWQESVSVCVCVTSSWIFMLLCVSRDNNWTCSCSICIDKFPAFFFGKTGEPFSEALNKRGESWACIYQASHNQSIICSRWVSYYLHYKLNYD